MRSEVRLIRGSPNGVHHARAQPCRPGSHRPERWSSSTGNGGRHQPETPVAMGRSAQKGAYCFRLHRDPRFEYSYREDGARTIPISGFRLRQLREKEQVEPSKWADEVYADWPESLKKSSQNCWVICNDFDWQIPHQKLGGLCRDTLTCETSKGGSFWRRAGRSEVRLFLMKLNTY